MQNQIRQKQQVYKKFWNNYIQTPKGGGGGGYKHDKQLAIWKKKIIVQIFRVNLVLVVFSSWLPINCAPCIIITFNNCNILNYIYTFNMRV